MMIKDNDLQENNFYPVNRFLQLLQTYLKFTEKLRSRSSAARFPIVGSYRSRTPQKLFSND